jgi:hypothetical protein
MGNTSQARMSALGQDRPFNPGQLNVRFAPKAAIRLARSIYHSLSL